MTRKRNYSVESVQRALVHHETTGALEHVSPPGEGQPKFRVRVAALRDDEEFTLREAWALCVGLAAAEQHYTKPPADVQQLRDELERLRGEHEFLQRDQEPLERRYHDAQAEVEALRSLLRELAVDVFGNAVQALAANPPDSWRHRLTRAIADVPIRPPSKPPRALGDAIDVALGGPEHYVSHHCRDGNHRICLGYYGGRTCECDDPAEHPLHRIPAGL